MSDTAVCKPYARITRRRGAPADDAVRVAIRLGKHLRRGRLGARSGGGGALKQGGLARERAARTGVSAACAIQNPPALQQQRRRGAQPQRAARAAAAWDARGQAAGISVWAACAHHQRLSLLLRQAGCQRVSRRARRVLQVAREGRSSQLRCCGAAAARRRRRRKRVRRHRRRGAQLTHAWRLRLRRAACGACCQACQAPHVRERAATRVRNEARTRPHAADEPVRMAARFDAPIVRQSTGTR